MNAELHKLYSLKSIVKFLLVLMMTSYMENFKGFRKGYTITFTIFQNTVHFYSLLGFMRQKIVTKSELRLSEVYRALNINTWFLVRKLYFSTSFVTRAKFTRTMTSIPIFFFEIL